MDGNEDADGDGAADASAGETDPVNADSDGDGIGDGTELGLTEPEDPEATDLSQGAFSPDEDPTTTSDPVDPDTDGDGVLDGEEDLDQDGAVDPDEGETDPNESDLLPGDFNGDGVVDMSDVQTILLGVVNK